jgi:hypothetical protein
VLLLSDQQYDQSRHGSEMHPFGVIEYCVFVKDLAECSATTHGVIYAKYVAQITKQQGRYAGHGWLLITLKHYQTLGGAGFSSLAMGRMIRTVVSRGISTGIKATHGKGRGAKSTTRISATPTSRRINIILPNHFRFWRFIRMSLLHAGSRANSASIPRKSLSNKWILQDDVAHI